MADAEKEKAEKVAAARKKYEQLKKQKEKGKKGDKKKKDDAKPSKEEAKDDTPAETTEDKPEEAAADVAAPEEDKDEDATEEKVEQPADAKDKVKSKEKGKDKDKDAAEDSSSRTAHNRKQSMSIQSKLRSESFRRGSQADPISPSPGEEVAEIYSKQKSRLEELERENKKLAKDLEAAETRSRKLEDEMEPLREENLKVADLKSKADKGEALASELERTKSELASAQRQNSHLQSMTSRTRGQSNASPSNAKDSDLQAQLDAKISTIESMSMELSSLQSQLSKSTSSTSSATDAHKEQVSALEAKLKKAEKTAEAAQSELKDLRAKVDKLSAAAVKDGSEKSSSVTRIAGLEHDLETARKSADEATKKAETLETKLETITKLQREAEPRRREAEKERENAVKEAAALKEKVVGLEAEARRFKLKERSKGEVDDDGIDELEDEERTRLESRVRELEGEVFELRRGVWRDKRIELQGGIDEVAPDRTIGSGGFDEVDLSGGSSGPAKHAVRQSVSKGRSGFANVFQSGLNAFTGGGNSQGQDEGLLDEDDMGDFDEDAFRRAHEEDAMKRIERVKDIKRGLKEWVGWRLDLVDQRMGGGGAGEIFDI